MACTETLRVGEWLAERASGELHGRSGTVRVEPKVMDLLFVLAEQPGAVIDRDTIMARLWPGLVVGDDSLARTVSKLRQALGDDARAPRYIETIAKRGYRCCASVTDTTAPTPHGTASGVAAALPDTQTPSRSSWRRPAAWAGLLLIASITVALMYRGWRDADPASPSAAVTVDERAALIARADDAYFQFSRADNEAAIELYQRVLGRHPDDASALAGLANALVQRALRWPQESGSPVAEFQRLGDALSNGHLDREPQRAQIGRARLLAERAVERAPDSAAAHKAAGFTASAQGRFDDALIAYRQAVALDPDAWGAMINIGDVLGILGRDGDALPWFERAYEAMERSYRAHPAQVRPWQASLGVLVALRHRNAGSEAVAETWFRRVLAHAPLDEAATLGLARLLHDSGDSEQADRLCRELQQRTTTGCD